MAIQYYMRGYNTSSPGTIGYVDWVVNDIPDSTATYIPSPYNAINIVNIIVNKTKTSKVDNFLKPFESLASIGSSGSDGYFFHLNSYDWLHNTPPGPPIPVPSYLIGLSVIRGSIDGVTPRDYSTLFWNESSGKWTFAYNTNGDGYTIGSLLPVSMGSSSFDGYITIGTNPAQSGIIRISNNEQIKSRNAGNTGDVAIIEVDSLNRVQIGEASNPIYIPSNLRIDGYVRDGGTSSISGFFRNANNTSIISFRNAANSNDIVALSSTAGNLVILGDAVNSGINFNTASGGEHTFKVNSANLLRIGNIGGTTYSNFENSSSFPTISQFDRSVGNGQNFTIKAQTTTALDGYGGSVIISSGDGALGDGYLDLRSDNVSQLRIFGSSTPVISDFTNNSSQNANSIQIFSPTIRFYNTVVAPKIIQDEVATSSIIGQPFTISSQNATGLNSYGGSLILKSGNGSADGYDGSLRLQSGLHDLVTLDGYNVSLFSLSGSFGSGKNVIFIANATTVPSTNPVGGGILYVESGALKYIGSSGTVTPIAPA